MLVLRLNEAMDQSVMANSVCWYGHVSRIEEGHGGSRLRRKYEG